MMDILPVRKIMQAYETLQEGWPQASPQQPETKTQLPPKNKRTIQLQPLRTQTKSCTRHSHSVKSESKKNPRLNPQNPNAASACIGGARN
ncbi:hypothetical protein LINPERHAP1_LOCUS24955 [Linum perenne]